MLIGHPSKLRLITGDRRQRVPVSTSTTKQRGAVDSQPPCSSLLLDDSCWSRAQTTNAGRREVTSAMELSSPGPSLWRRGCYVRQPRQRGRRAGVWWTTAGCEERNDGHDVKPAVTGSARRGSGRVKPLFWVRAVDSCLTTLVAVWGRCNDA